MPTLLNDVKQEFWGDLQADLFTANSAVWLANQRLEDIIKTDGRKAHRPILSHPLFGTYTPYTDISFTQKRAEKQTLEVDTFEFAAEEIDIVDQNQNPYGLVEHSLNSIRKGIMNRVEQIYLSEISNSGHNVFSSATAVGSNNILDVLEDAEGKLGSFDAPYETAMRALVLDPRTVAKLRRAKSDRETRLGDQSLANGVVGPWQGWTVIQNNNLPWSATFTMDTNPTDGDTITIDGVVLEFQDDLADVTSGNVGILRDGSTVDTSRSNLSKFFANTGTAGTEYTQPSPRQDFILRRKRRIRATTAEAMAFTGFGAPSVSQSMTASTNLWSAQQVENCAMIRGSIDMVMQFIDVRLGDKEKGFASLPKGLVGIGTKTFEDGADLMVRVLTDASSF